jgi:hypothetical protein
MMVDKSHVAVVEYTTDNIQTAHDVVTRLSGATSQKLKFSALSVLSTKSTPAATAYATKAIVFAMTDGGILAAFEEIQK